MKFGPVPLEHAEGAILAHALSPPDGGRKLAKGSLLGPEEIARLHAAGVPEVIVARLDPGDIEENRAAARLAEAVAPDPGAQGLRVTGAGAGRVNLYANGPGVVEIDTAAVRRLNGVDPMITLATLGQHTRVDPGTMVGTIKIIAYAVQDAALGKAAEAGRAALRVRAPVVSTATLIETRVGDAPVAGKGRAATSARLDRLGVSLSDRVVVPHRRDEIATAITAAPGELILILTASATSDIADVAPSALRDAGGAVTAYGMPVDPGNLLFFGSLCAKPVIGLPGCARSPALNGADWVLERLVCGIPLSQDDIAAMGVGGLLKEIPTRPRPRGERPRRPATGE